MKTVFLACAMLVLAQFGSNAQNFSYSNTSCSDVYIVLYADDNGNCGAITAQSDPFLVPANTSGSFPFSCTTPPVGSGFTWNGSITPGSCGFTFVYAEVSNPCVPVTFPTAQSCTASPTLYDDGVSVDNPNCGPGNMAAFYILTGNSCFHTGDLCAPCPFPQPITVKFSIPNPPDWDISIF